MSAVRRLGIFGGAFDPPHLAHEALAQLAISQYALDELRIVPTGVAWHKSRALTPASHRVAMSKLAFADLPQARIDSRETLRSGATYSIDTLLELRAENPQAELFLLMGEDQLAFFPQWHRFQEILQIATLLVAFRADSMPANAQKDPINQGKIKHSTIHMPASPISATQIRQLCSHSQAIDHLVKPSVARYIAEHRLYLLT
ncbi:nicotinate (nicotinamide) nucleotide adenylyltransferase [Variovorax sp. PCZ-1]|uniref:nicotinate (nicotinamide) nucleotide adenylyltransferase n=1 Tax=Variovorax sp. PCZ-1 TaxID=2835533 RepID=UPI0020C131C9|nr:nicotinate (nicotinamide) nucleotide adenylyltransferase [Variovorax sp. PCZ-1]